MTELPFKSLPIPNDWERTGLPAWTYRAPELFALERDGVFLNHWQVVGHESDVPGPGNWLPPPWRICCNRSSNGRG